MVISETARPPGTTKAGSSGVVVRLYSGLRMNVPIQLHSVSPRDPRDSHLPVELLPISTGLHVAPGCKQRPPLKPLHIWASLVAGVTVNAPMVSTIARQVRGHKQIMVEPLGHEGGPRPAWLAKP